MAKKRISMLVLAGLLSACSSVATGSPAAPSSAGAPTPPFNGLTLAEAIQIARAAVPERPPSSIADGEALQYRDAQTHGITLDPAPEPDAWLWLITLAGSGEGTWVVIDFVDGTVLRTIEWIA